MPEAIISDRGLQICEQILGRRCSLYSERIYGLVLFFILETDGQSEVTIHVLENFLRPYIERRPSTWIAQLPLVELCC